MPVVAVFFGIVIRMFYREHEPEHAEHQGQHGKFEFAGRMIVGNITSKTALRLIRDWARQHSTELEANWAKMKAGSRSIGLLRSSEDQEHGLLAPCRVGHPRARISDPAAVQ